MSTDLLYCFENESAEDVSQKMGGWWVRRLAVVKQDKRLIGMVSLADLTALNADPKPIRMRLHRYKAARPARQTRRACVAGANHSHQAVVFFDRKCLKVEVGHEPCCRRERVVGGHYLDVGRHHIANFHRSPPISIMIGRNSGEGPTTVSSNPLQRRPGG